MARTTLTRMAATLALGWMLIAGNALAQDIAGAYAMSGTSLTGAPYSGTTTITRTGETFAIEQNQGGGILEGTGILHGDTLAAVFAAGGDSFVAIYDLQPDGSLVGEWTSFGSPTVGTETLQPLGGGGGGSAK